MLIRTIYVGVLDTSEGTGRDILRAKTEKELAETVCYYNTIYDGDMWSLWPLAQSRRVQP